MIGYFIRATPRGFILRTVLRPEDHPEWDDVEIPVQIDPEGNLGEALNVVVDMVFAATTAQRRRLEAWNRLVIAAGEGN